VSEGASVTVEIGGIKKKGLWAALSVAALLVIAIIVFSPSRKAAAPSGPEANEAAPPAASGGPSGGAPQPAPPPSNSVTGAPRDLSLRVNSDDAAARFALVDASAKVVSEAPTGSVVTVAPGTYQLHVSAPNRQTLSRKLVVTDGHSQFEAKLCPLTRTIQRERRETVRNPVDPAEFNLAGQRFDEKTCWSKQQCKAVGDDLWVKIKSKVSAANIGTSLCQQWRRDAYRVRGTGSAEEAGGLLLDARCDPDTSGASADCYILVSRGLCRVKATETVRMEKVEVQEPFECPDGSLFFRELQ